MSEDFLADYIHKDKVRAVLREYLTEKSKSKPDIYQHPEYIRVVRLLNKKNRDSSDRYSKLPIEQHPDFERLVKSINDKCNATPSDIRLHPDYAYFAAFYEDKIAKLKTESKSK